MDWIFWTILALVGLCVLIGGIIAYRGRAAIQPPGEQEAIPPSPEHAP